MQLAQRPRWLLLNDSFIKPMPLLKSSSITDDVAKESVAKALTACDYLFLAADSMRARLVVNAIIHQYLIPGVQLGSKIRPDATGGAG